MVRSNRVLRNWAAGPIGPDPSNRTTGLGTHSLLRDGSGATCPRREDAQRLLPWVWTPTGGPEPLCVPPGPPCVGPGPPRKPSKPPWVGPWPPRMSFGPPWWILDHHVHRTDPHGRVLDLHVCRSNPQRWVSDLLSYIQTPTGRTQVFRPACALGPHSLLGQESSVDTWLMAAWQKPSDRSKLTACIQCERLMCALLRTGQGKAFVWLRRPKWLGRALPRQTQMTGSSITELLTTLQEICPFMTKYLMTRSVIII
jgi:hypothetical protein